MTEATSPRHPVRFVTAASLFDGHDASINIMRRILQSQGCEVIHLGHDRSVEQVVRAALQEDVQGIALSSYQGGHVEYFSYLREMLNEQGAEHIKIYGGGGGVIVPAEIELLASRGVRIFSPEDGQRLGLVGMIASMVEECDVALDDEPAADAVLAGHDTALARAITLLEDGRASDTLRDELAKAGAASSTPVLGITGTGGSGKSSLTDELLRRFRADQEGKLRIAVIAVDPTRRKGGGALLGDRIRMNAVDLGGVYFRSLATRRAGSEIPDHLAEVIAACKSTHDLVIVETPGIGQGDAGIVPFCDVSLYVMTPEFGAASQLEKIDMLDFADAVAINKFERRGAEDARRDVSRQLMRNREAFGSSWEEMPVFGTSAARFADDGVTALYLYLRDLLKEKGLTAGEGILAPVDTHQPTELTTVVPPARVRYLSEIAESIRSYHQQTDDQAAIARRAQHLETAAQMLIAEGADATAVEALLAAQQAELDPQVAALLEAWPAVREQYEADELVVRIRDKELHTQLWRTTLSGNRMPRVAVPKTDEAGELVRYLREENLPGSFPYTAGVSPSSARARPRPACSPGRVIPTEPTAASTCWPRVSRPRDCRQPSTR